MRRRGNRLPGSPPEPSPPMAASDAVVEATSPVPASIPGTTPWRVEQLQALGPVTGPSHRSSVPIVRSTVKDNALVERAETSLPQTELTFISEGLESWKRSGSP
jgi:hypothetical protein